MTKMLTLMLVSILSAAPADPVPAIAAFEVVWVPFLRQLAGCPISAPITDAARQCNARQGSWNYELYMKSRKAAAKVFDFKE